MCIHGTYILYFFCYRVLYVYLSIHQFWKIRYKYVVEECVHTKNTQRFRNQFFFFSFFNKPIEWLKHLSHPKIAFSPISKEYTTFIFRKNDSSVRIDERSGSFSPQLQRFENRPFSRPTTLATRLTHVGCVYPVGTTPET